MDTIVLVVEDDGNVASLLRRVLERVGLRVVAVRTGEEGLSELERRSVALAILDIGLPGIDGLDVLRRIRSSSDVPIIMLTARDDELDRVTGLELGADDYVCKPFSPREFVARVKALLRRTRVYRPAPVLRLGDLVLRRPEHEVTFCGGAVELSPREFELLTFLMENPGVVFSREQLLEHVWHLGFACGTRTVDQHIAQLRAKLGRPDLVETIRGVGYKAIRP